MSSRPVFTLFGIYFRPRLRRQSALLGDPEVLECRTLLTAEFGAASVEGQIVAETAVTLSVTFPETMRVGQLAIPVSVSASTNVADHYLDGWIDWNGDGNWGGPAEHVAARVLAVDDHFTFRIDVPAWAKSGVTAASFRLSSAAGELSESREQQFTLLPPLRTTGDFGAANSIATTAAVQFITAADLDGDGDLDILSATFDGDGTIAWDENNGNQGFSRHIITTTASEATCVIAVDMNGDGYLDVVASSLGNNTISWYENDGHQQFTRYIITNSASKVSNVFVADLDGDGDPDLVAATKGNNTIAWYENDGQQVFTKHIITNSVSAPCVVSVADMDGDGDLDVVAAIFSNNAIFWYENDGSQGFTKQDVSQTANGVRSMFVADLDGDGDQDVVASSLYANKIAWYENDGQGRFIERIISSTALSASAVSVADMDGDGDLDVLGASRGDQTLAWFENVGTLNFPQHTITTKNVEARSVIAADVDGDGDLDVVSATKYGNRLAWYENTIATTPLSIALTSTVSAHTSTPTIPVAVSFNRPVTGLTAASFVVHNGSLKNFVGHGSTFSFDLIANGDGPVSVTLPAGAAQDLAGVGNSSTSLSREFTSVPPAVTGPNVAATFVRNARPVSVMPSVSVSGSRVGGGTLVVILTSTRGARLKFDVLDDTALSPLGSVVRASNPGNQVITLTLNPATTAQDIQAALRETTFSTSRGGLSRKTRQLEVRLTDVTGQSGVSSYQTINVLRNRRTVRGPSVWPRKSVAVISLRE